jgi:hypothetical protein
MTLQDNYGGEKGTMPISPQLNQFPQPAEPNQFPQSPQSHQYPQSSQSNSIDNQTRAAGSLGLTDQVQLISPTPYARDEHLPEDLTGEFPNQLTRLRRKGREYFAEFIVSVNRSKLFEHN